MNKNTIIFLAYCLITLINGGIILLDKLWHPSGFTELSCDNYRSFQCNGIIKVIDRPIEEILGIREMRKFAK